MVSKEKKSSKDSFFSLPTEDRLDFELEDKEKEEKETATEKVFDKLNGKNKKKQILHFTTKRERMKYITIGIQTY